MLDFFKKLIVSNRYSLIVLLILSLWLKLARDYNVFLSYIVLIILYLIIGMLVGIALDYLQGKKEEKETSNKQGNLSQRKIVTKPIQRANAETKRSVPSHHEAILNHSSGTRSTKESSAAKVTSSYIKGTDGIPSSMSRRLEKTAATFNSIKEDSDKYAEEERKYSTLYGNTQKSLFNNPEDLYKNKKVDKSAKVVPVVDNTAEEEKNKKESIKKEEVVVNTTTEFADFSDYTTDATKDSEIDEISKEINERISQNTSTRHRKISPPKEISFVPKDNIRPTAPKSSPVTTSRPTSKIQEEKSMPNPVFGAKPVEQQPVSQRKTHVVKDESEDKVNADMAKLDKLFNHSKDDKNDKKPKNGLFSAFKKKR